MNLAPCGRLVAIPVSDESVLDYSLNEEFEMSNVATHGKAYLARPEACRPDTLDTLANAWQAHSTGGLSPAAGLLAWYDWALDLSLSPGKQRSLMENGLHKRQRLARSQCARLFDLHRTAGAGSALCHPGLAAVAVQRDSPGLFAAAAVVVVAQRHHRRAWRVAPSREHGHFRQAAMAGLPLLSWRLWIPNTIEPAAIIHQAAYLTRGSWK